MDRTSRQISYRAIEMFGLSDSEISKLDLYTEADFSGINFASSETNRTIQLPRKMMILSWHFSGLTDWLVYEERNFTGNSTCLRRKDGVNEKGYGFTLNLRSRLIAGSAQPGSCENESSTLKMSSSVIALLTLWASVNFLKN